MLRLTQEGFNGAFWHGVCMKHVPFSRGEAKYSHSLHLVAHKLVQLDLAIVFLVRLSCIIFIRFCQHIMYSVALQCTAIHFQSRHGHPRLLIKRTFACGDEIRRDVASVKLHAFNDFKLILQCFAILEVLK